MLNSGGPRGGAQGDARGAHLGGAQDARGDARGAHLNGRDEGRTTSTVVEPAHRHLENLIIGRIIGFFRVSSIPPLLMV